MRSEETSPPRVPPRWLVHGAWRVHRALYKLSGGRFLWTTSSKRGWGALRLTTVGRKSGHLRTPVLLEIRVSFVGIPLDVHGWSVVAGI